MATFTTSSRRATALAAALFYGDPGHGERRAQRRVDACPYQVSTPPAVDSSEVPTAGDPRTVGGPRHPVGGDALAAAA